MTWFGGCRASSAKWPALASAPFCSSFRSILHFECLMLNSDGLLPRDHRNYSQPIMGLLFRRGIRLGKFARINVGKKGASLSVGVRGAKVNVGAQGTRVTMGLPGSGVAYSTRLASHGVRPSSTVAPGGGCLRAMGVLVLLVIAGAVGLADKSPMAALFATLILIVGWVSISRWFANRETAKLVATAEAAAIEEQRQLAAAQAEQERQRNERWTYLCHRYGEENAHKVWNGQIWLGCTVDLMIEILGQPFAVDQKVLKTKTSRTFKYRPIGASRYALRVYAEDDEVTGWEEKGD